MKLSVLTNLFANLTLDEALAKFEALGIESVEIGCGGYPGKAHCNPEVLLADEAALNEWLATFKKHNIEICALSCHGNPVHPDREIAKSFHDDFIVSPFDCAYHIISDYNSATVKSGVLYNSASNKTPLFDNYAAIKIFAKSISE